MRARIRLAAMLAVLVPALGIQALNAQWAATPGTTVRDEFGPDLGYGAALCRGACGPDCPETCKESFYWECIDANRFRLVQTFDCGTHQGCREHDDCLDKCSERFPGSARSEYKDFKGWKRARNFYTADCSFECHKQCPLTNDPVSCAHWIPGHESPVRPFDGRTVFEYTKRSPSGEDVFYRCPDGMKLACTNGRGRCVDDEGEPAEPRVARPIGVFIGPESACIDRGEAGLQLHASVIGLPKGRVHWSVVSGPGRIDPQSGWLTPTGDGVVTVRAVSAIDPLLSDHAAVEVGRCSCAFSAVLSGDTTKGNARGKVAHFSTNGHTTIAGGSSNPGAFDDAMGLFGGPMSPEQQARAEEWKRAMAAMPRETLGISVLEADPDSEGEAMFAAAVRGFKLQASVFDEPIEPGFAGPLPLGQVVIHTGEYTDGGYPAAYEWAPGAPGTIHLIVSHYNGRSLSGTITGNMFAPRLYKESTGERPQISFSVSFYALEFDPLNLQFGCVVP